MSVTIPFTVEEFFAIFARYNEAVWPAQRVLYALALVVTFLAIRRYRFSNQIIALILGFMWLWMGLVYHIGFFSAVNSLAIVFGVLFVIQFGLLIWTGLWKRNLRFRVTFNLRGVVGGLFILYAFLIYPALGLYLGHRYPSAPTFGLPCPTTIFTFGLLLWTDSKSPLLLLVIPAIWSAIGFIAAVRLNVPQDFGLLAAALIGSILLVLRNRNEKVPATKLA